FLPHDSMRPHLGLATRAAPLTDRVRTKIDLLLALMFGLPRAPFIYYGDELRTHDDPSLPDRDAVRTPMQRTRRRGAGRPTPDPPKRPIVGGAGISVDEQRHDPHSLLRFVRSLIACRTSHPELGIGTYEAIEVSEPALLAVTRTLKAEDRVIASDPLSSAPLVCLYNFAPHPLAIPPQALANLSGIGRVEMGSAEAGSEIHSGDIIPAFGFLWLTAP